MTVVILGLNDYCSAVLIFKTVLILAPMLKYIFCYIITYFLYIFLYAAHFWFNCTTVGAHV